MTRRALLSMLAAVPFVGKMLPREPGPTRTEHDRWLYYQRGTWDHGTGTWVGITETRVDRTCGACEIWRDGAWVKRG